MRVEIYADLACPWCFMAKRRFEWALAVFERRDEVDVVLRPYQLDPTLPADPDSVEASVKAAAAEGIDYRAGEVVLANTLPAHRLVWLASRECSSEVARQLMDRLFLAYFTEGLNISDAGTLAEIAARTGMDAGRVRRFLASDEGVDEVGEELREAYQRGITAVPTLVFGNGRVVIGAQDSLTYLDLLEQLARDTDQNLTSAEATVSEDRACA
jgi:predicted DsbA family dithiol-disulfide isomerase